MQNSHIISTMFNDVIHLKFQQIKTNALTYESLSHASQAMTMQVKQKIIICVFEVHLGVKMLKIRKMFFLYKSKISLCELFVFLQACIRLKFVNSAFLHLGSFIHK